MVDENLVDKQDADVLIDHMHCFFCWRAIPLDFDAEGKQTTEVTYVTAALPMVQQVPPQLIGAQPQQQIVMKPHNYPICERCKQQQMSPSKLAVPAKSPLHIAH